MQRSRDDLSRLTSSENPLGGFDIEDDASLLESRDGERFRNGIDGLGAVDGELARRGRSDVLVDEPSLALFRAVVVVRVVGLLALALLLLGGGLVGLGVGVEIVLGEDDSGALRVAGTSATDLAGAGRGSRGGDLEGCRMREVSLAARLEGRGSVRDATRVPNPPPPALPLFSSVFASGSALIWARKDLRMVVQPVRVSEGEGGGREGGKSTKQFSRVLNALHRSPRPLSLTSTEAWQTGWETTTNHQRGQAGRNPPPLAPATPPTSPSKVQLAAPTSPSPKTPTALTPALSTSSTRPSVQNRSPRGREEEERSCRTLRDGGPSTSQTTSLATMGGTLRSSTSRLTLCAPFPRLSADQADLFPPTSFLSSLVLASAGRLQRRVGSLQHRSHRYCPCQAGGRRESRRHRVREDREHEEQRRRA